MAPSEREKILQRLWLKAAVGFDDMREAAEFESRVVAKLAKVISNLVKENPFSDDEAQATTPDLVLKWARLSVEEEMDD